MARREAWDGKAGQVFCRVAPSIAGRLAAFVMAVSFGCLSFFTVLADLRPILSPNLVI
jgi:hypothetical protein